MQYVRMLTNSIVAGALPIFLFARAVVLLGASYWRGALIGPGLAAVVVAAYLLPYLFAHGS